MVDASNHCYAKMADLTFKKRMYLNFITKIEKILKLKVNLFKFIQFF